MTVLENLRNKYAERDDLVLRRVQEHQKDIEDPLTFSEVVVEDVSELYWEDGFVDDVQAYCAYLSYAAPFGEEDSVALRSALFQYHMDEQDASFKWAMDDIKHELREEREKSHITA